MTSAEDAAKAELARLKGIHTGKGRVILAVDPGTAATGICLLVDGEPLWIKVLAVKGSDARDRLPEMCRRTYEAIEHAMATYDIDTIAIEWQASRPTDKRPDDIIHLGMVVGAALSGIPDYWLGKLHTPLPVQWKGSVSGDKFVARIRQRYPAAGDLMHRVPEHLKHNGFDALGLALWSINKALPWRL